MAPQFGDVGGETSFGKQAGDFRTQPVGREFGFDEGTSEYVPCLFLHATAILPGATLQPRLHLILNVPDNELGHGRLPISDIMISLKRRRIKRVARLILRNQVGL
jgi:hypothetical protein